MLNVFSYCPGRASENVHEGLEENVLLIAVHTCFCCMVASLHVLQLQHVRGTNHRTEGWQIRFVFHPKGINVATTDMRVFIDIITDVKNTISQVVNRRPSCYYVTRCC